MSDGSNSTVYSNSTAYNNSTSYNNSTAYNISVDNSEYIRKIINVIVSIDAALYVVVFVYGVASWCLLSKFRHLRNYALLNIFVAHLLQFVAASTQQTVDMICLREESTEEECVIAGQCYVFSLLFCTFLKEYWLLVLCYIFYCDIVNVFKVNIRKRYLISNVCAWGASLVSTFFVYIACYISIGDSSGLCLSILTSFYSVSVTPELISVVLYVTVLYSLFRGSDAGVATSVSKRRRFYIATLIFVLCNVAMLPYVLYNIAAESSVDFGEKFSLIIEIIAFCLEILNKIALFVFFVVGKSNRELWREFINKRKAKSAIEMT